MQSPTPGNPVDSQVIWFRSLLSNRLRRPSAGSRRAYSTCGMAKRFGSRASSPTSSVPRTRARRFPRLAHGCASGAASDPASSGGRNFLDTLAATPSPEGTPPPRTGRGSVLGQGRTGARGSAMCREESRRSDVQVTARYRPRARREWRRSRTRVSLAQYPVLIVVPLTPREAPSKR